MARRSAPAGCRRDRRAVRSPRSCASRSVSARPGGVRRDGRWRPRWTDRGRPARSRRCGHAPAGRRRRPGRRWRRGQGHGHVDVVVLAEEDPLEPVLLDPGQVPDEAGQAGPGRHTGGALLFGGQPADTRTTASRTVVRKYNSTSRSDSATSRPALSLTLNRLRSGPARVAGHPRTQATGRAARRLPARVP